MPNRVSLTLYNHWVVRIPFFRGLGEQTRTMLCRLVRCTTVPKDGDVGSLYLRRLAIVPFVQTNNSVGCFEQVFIEGESSTEMYIIMSGEVEVEKAGASLGFLSEGAFFGETALMNAVTGRVDEAWVRTRTIR